LVVHFESHERLYINKTSNPKTDNKPANAAIGCPHRAYQLLASLCKICIAGYRLDVVGYVVAFEEAGEDSTSTQRVGVECDEDQHGRRGSMMRPEEMEV
jgi:hypothetical protein